MRALQPKIAKGQRTFDERSKLQKCLTLTDFNDFCVQLYVFLHGKLKYELFKGKKYHFNLET